MIVLVDGARERPQRFRLFAERRFDRGEAERRDGERTQLGEQRLRLLRASAQRQAARLVRADEGAAAREARRREVRGGRLVEAPQRIERQAQAPVAHRELGCERQQALLPLDVGRMLLRQVHMETHAGARGQRQGIDRKRALQLVERLFKTADHREVERAPLARLGALRRQLDRAQQVVAGAREVPTREEAGERARQARLERFRIERRGAKGGRARRRESYTWVAEAEDRLHGRGVRQAGVRQREVGIERQRRAVFLLGERQ